jgi:hypothetical protein
MLKVQELSRVIEAVVTASTAIGDLLPSQGNYYLAKQ